MPSSCHQVKYQYTAGQGGKSSGRYRHWHPVLALKRADGFLQAAAGFLAAELDRPHTRS